MFLSQNVGLGMGLSTIVFAILIRLVFIQTNIASVSNFN